MQYIHGDWSHIFHQNGPDVSVRICFDTQRNALTHMKVKTAKGWAKPSQEELADVEDSLKTANSEALENPDHWGLEASDTPPAWVPTTIRLVLDVDFILNGVSKETLADNLRNLVTQGYYNGLMSGDTAAEISDYGVKTIVLSQPLPEAELVEHFAQRINDGQLSAEDIPVRLARYGQMDATDFDDEMRERMGK